MERSSEFDGSHSDPRDCGDSSREYAEFAEDVRADEQCPLCDGPMFIHDDEKVCGDCYYVSEPPKRKAMPDPWERFQRDRREWVAEEDGRGGWTGPTRVKMVGGFAGPYVYGEGDSIEDRVYG